MRTRIDEIVARVERTLLSHPNDLLAWEPIPLASYEVPLPQMIRSSWVFVLRGETVSGAERHPNSHQRVMSYRGSADLQTQHDGVWQSHRLTSDPAAPLAARWASIPPNVWHQGVVPTEHWAVVSFHTVLDNELIEERPVADAESDTRQRRYVES